MKHKMKNTFKNSIILALVSILCFGCAIFDDWLGDKPPLELADAFEMTEVPADGLPYVLKSNGANLLGRYGVIPQITISGNSDNSFDIAWLDMTSKTINVSIYDRHGNPKNNIKPAFIGTTTRLLGFTKVITDGSYVVGYSKDNASGDKNYEYWISRFDGTGKMIFNTRIFGDRPSTELYSKGSPGQASSARIVFNKQTQKIGFFTGHTMLWPDGRRHQGGYIGFLNLDGTPVTKNNTSPIGNTWFFSHNFDQRLMVVEGTYYALSHGDAYPRALGFSAWSDDPAATSNPSVNVQYFAIPGTTGDNTTDTQTGGFTNLPDGNFGVVFASSIGRTKRDICVMKIDKSGNILFTKWLTQNTNSNAVNPKISVRNGNILVAWEDYISGGLTAYFMELDLNGEISADKVTSAGFALQPLSDWVTLPDGDIIWALGTSDNKFQVFRIKK